MAIYIQIHCRRYTVNYRHSIKSSNYHILYIIYTLYSSVFRRYSLICNRNKFQDLGVLILGFVTYYYTTTVKFDYGNSIIVTCIILY